MRKTNRNLARIKFIKKVIWYAAVQVIIILVFLWMWDTTKPATNNNTSQLSGIPENIELELPIFLHEETIINLYFDGVEYSCVARTTYYHEGMSIDELKAMLCEKELHITYFVGNNRVLDMRNEDRVFESIENHNKWSRIFIPLFVFLFLFAEFVFMWAFVWLGIRLDWNDIKPSKKKKRKKTRKKTQITADDSSS